MSTFTWHPKTADKTVAPHVMRAPFGDGYEQRAADGINSQPATWSLSFVRTLAEINAIEAFLEATKGTESFDWTDPHGVAIKVTCPGWSRSVISGMFAGALSATFVQVFE